LNIIQALEYFQASTHRKMAMILRREAYSVDSLRATWHQLVDQFMVQTITDALVVCFLLDPS
jgi:hypothetical protein